MPRESLSITHMVGVNFIHQNIRAISQRLQPPALSRTAQLRPSGKYSTMFSIDSPYNVADTSTTLLSSSLLERIYRLPRSEQGGLQVTIVATGPELIQLADKIAAQDELASAEFPPQLLQANQLGYDLRDTAATFDVRGFMQGLATSVVLFSIKKPFAEFSVQDHGVLFNFVNRFLNNAGPILGFDSTAVKTLCLAIHLFQNFATITKVSTVGTAGDEIKKIIKQQAQEDVMLIGADYAEALKLANTFAAQEIICNSGVAIIEKLNNCQGDYKDVEITRVVGLFKTLSTASQQLDFVAVFQVIQDIESFLKETQRPGSFWGIFYVSWDNVFRQALTDLQQTIAIYMLNVNMRPVQARAQKRSLGGAAELPMAKKRTDLGVPHPVYRGVAGETIEPTPASMDVVETPVDILRSSPSQQQ